MTTRYANIASCISSICLAAVLMNSVVTSSIGITFLCSCFGSRYDIWIDRGDVIVRRLHNYRFGTSLNWGFYKVAPEKQLEALKKLPAWWHGDNSKWEGIGYTVRERFRLCGFELASGRYWPPFFWQHPKVPFTILQIPLWSIAALCAAFPLCHIGAVVYARIRRKKPVSTAVSEAESQAGT